MPVNRESALKTAATNKRLYGKGFYSKIGKDGGNTITENTKKRGFGSNPDLARQMGLKKRGKTKKIT